MIKLYPPYIEGSIPAFYGKELTVPYEMNKTVGYKDISGFKLKIITVSTNRTIQIIDDNGYNIETHEAYFNMPIEKMVVGQFYKVQLAYKDTAGEVGFYSTIGVVKYSAEPIVSIAGLEAGNINLHQYDYVGYYEPVKQDPTEAEIYYQFDVYDYNDKLYASSGKKIHNATIEGGDLYRLADSFEKQQVYSIRYTVWTLNGLKVSTRRYRLMERQSLDIEIEAELAVDLNYDEGYINVSLLDTAEDEQVAEGAFLITRADSLSDFKQWNELYRFELRNQRLKSFSFKDFTTQQGVEYQYSIQQYNDNGLYSNRLLSKVIKSDFEDCFLYDGDRQLKIRFNPKMTSFKNTVLETKVNTIGSKYPFIFRNGNVSYKEFPVGGLISYLSDNENLFLKEYDLDDLHRHSTPADDDNILNYLPTDLVSDNLTKERLFKLEVLEWLTNGEPKLFRSPTEGNYIVRLLSANMTPEQALGRMLHNFTATAYEVAEFNYNNLIFYRFVNPNGIDKAQMKWATIELATINNGAVEYRTGQLNNYPAITVEFTGMMPGDKIWLDDEEIQIGVNGSYYASLDNPIKSIRVPEGAQYIGFMTYGYYGESLSKFNEIFNIELNEVPGWRIENLTNKTSGGTWLDVLANIEDARTELVQFYYLRFRKADHLSPKPNDEQNNIYPILNNDEYNEKNEYSILIGNEFISIKEIETYEIRDLDRPAYLWIGPDVICEAGFQTKIIEYNIENSNKELSQLKTNWLDAIKNYQLMLENYPEILKDLQDKLAYHEYMIKINEEKRRLSVQERDSLKAENDILINEDYYKLLTFDEAQHFTNYRIKINNSDDMNQFDSPRDPWNEIYDQILIEIELAKREDNVELEEYWMARRNELYTIMKNHLPEDYNYIFKRDEDEFKDYSSEQLTTILYNREKKYSYQPKDKVYHTDEDGNEYVIAQPGVQVTICEKNPDTKPPSEGDAHAYYMPAIGSWPNKTEPQGNMIKDSMWIDTQDKVTQLFEGDEVKFDVNTYIGPSDPYTMEIEVELWIDNSDITDIFEDSLQKTVDIFYYNGESYKDIAYLDPVLYKVSQEKFNEVYEYDMLRLNKQKNDVKAKIEESKINVLNQEDDVYNAKQAIAQYNKTVKELEKKVTDAKHNYDMIKDSADDDPENERLAWENAKTELSNYQKTLLPLEEELAFQQDKLNKLNKKLAEEQSELTKVEENIEWLENSKDYLINMSEGYYIKDNVGIFANYYDGGWCSATLRHRIEDNQSYKDIYNNAQAQINSKRNQIFGLVPEIKPHELTIENYYYTNQELTLEEKTTVEDLILQSTDGKYSYDIKKQLDGLWEDILAIQLKMEDDLKDIPIANMDFREPEKYILLFSRSHYIEDPDTKRPIHKGYCMYQFYDRATAEYRVKQLEIGIDSYLKKYGIKEVEVEDQLIRNDINERDELLAYLKYLKEFYPQDALSAPGYNIFRPISLNEIRDKKLSIEEELELAYKHYTENLPEPRPFKRLEVGNNIEDSEFYYRTGNYLKIKENIDRIAELEDIIKEINSWKENDPEGEIEEINKQIIEQETALKNARNMIFAEYKLYIDKLEEVLEEEEDK